MHDKPDACGLNPTEWTEARAEYAALAARYHVTVTPGDGAVEMTLTGDKPGIRAALDRMVAREAGCCDFLHFALEETADGWRVHLTGDGLDTPALLLATYTIFPPPRRGTALPVL